MAKIYFLTKGNNKFNIYIFPRPWYCISTIPFLRTIFKTTFQGMSQTFQFKLLKNIRPQATDFSSSHHYIIRRTKSIDDTLSMSFSNHSHLYN